MKLSMEDLKNITPVGEKVELSFEKDYNGVEEKIEITVYPLKAMEKIDIQKYSDELNKLIKLENKRNDDEDRRLIELNDLINLKYAFFTMRKNIPEITEEFITEKFPKIWYKQIFEATLKAEGIRFKDIENEKN